VSLGDDLDGAVDHREGVTLGNRFAQGVDQGVMDTWVLDAGGSEQNLTMRLLRR
jgi:hypothetical protein